MIHAGFGSDFSNPYHGKDPENDNDYAEKTAKGRKQYQYFVKLN